MSGRPDDERARLERELEALGEQVKLLTRTEHRLHRSQADLDRQLERIEALAEFSFRAARAEDSGEVVFRALEILAQTYDVDGGCAVTAAKPGGPLTRWLTEPVRELDPAAILELVDSVRTVKVVDLAAESELAFRARQVFGASGARVVVLMSLRDAEGRVLAGLTAWKGPGRASYYSEELLGAHDAYLFALASHAARAIEGVRLTNALQARSDELARSNARLQRSLDDLESTQAALLESQKLEALARLAGGVAHDFNNLMTLVLGHVDFVEEGLPDPPSRATLEEVRTAVTKASELTAQLLAFGRSQPSRPVPTDLSTAIPPSIKAIRPALREDIDVSIESTPSLPEVVIDQRQLDQILLNLALNARDAMPSGGTLRVRSRRASQEDLDVVGLDRRWSPSRFVTLEVSDTGRGMTKEVLERVFEPFFTTKELGRGSGLGLASVYGLVHQNGGHIGVSSHHGGGTQFVVLLPAAAPTSFEPESSSAGAPVILVVEDNDGIRALCARVLQKAGYQVLLAGDGIDALAMLERADGVDLVVTDVIMPRMGGGKLARRVRARYGDVPVLFISGHPFDELDVPALDGGLDHYLPKPFSPGSLRDAVQAALQQSPVDRT